MFGRIKAAAAVVFHRSQSGLTLISNWLANALWLIETKFLSLAKQGYGGNAVVYACLRYLSQSVPEAALKAYTKGDDKTEVPENHPLAMLIRDPNELMTEYEMWELATIHLGITGRTTWWKERDNAGRIIGLYPLRPDRVGPIYSDSNKAGMKVLLGWSYQVPGSGEFVALPRQDVLMVNFANPFEESGGLVEGLGPLQVLAAEVSADNEATSFVGALLKNYAAPTTIIKTKAPIPDKKTADILKAKFRMEFGGARRGIPAVLDGETDVTSLGFNLQELEFPDLRDIAESRIAAAFGVPAGLVGLNVGLKRNTMANLQESRRYAAETTLANYWRRFADVWNRDIVPEFGDDLIVEFDTSDVKALAGQRQEEIAPVVDGFGKGIVTLNEYRQALKMDPLDPAEGDVLYIPSGVTVVAATEEARKVLDERQQLLLAAQTEQQPEATMGAEEPPLREKVESLGTLIRSGFDPGESVQTAGLPPIKHLGYLPVTLKVDDPEPPEPPPTNGAQPPKPGQPKEPEEGEEPEEKEPPNGQQPPAKSVKVATDDDERRTAAEKRLEKRINGAFQAHLDDILRQITNGQEPDLSGLNDDLLKALETELIDIAASQAERDSMTIGVGFDPALINTAALEWAKKYAGAELDIIDSTTREFVKKAVATFIGTPGVTNEQLIELLKAGGFSANRARTIAITEVTSAFASGSHIAQQELMKAGIPTVKIFRTSADSLVCPICGPSNGKPESEWDGAGSPPRHSRCRCWLTLENEE